MKGEDDPDSVFRLDLNINPPSRPDHLSTCVPERAAKASPNNGPMSSMTPDPSDSAVVASEDGEPSWAIRPGVLGRIRHRHGPRYEHNQSGVRKTDTTEKVAFRDTMANDSRPPSKTEVSTSGLQVIVSDELPSIYDAYVEHALLVDEIELKTPDRSLSFVAVRLGRSGASSWPALVVAQTYEPGPISGFSPGVAVVPETGLVLIGAGERLAAYKVADVVTERLWQDDRGADFGFWGWDVTPDVVLALGELTFAAFARDGQPLWSTWVEPLWDYSIEDGVVRLDNGRDPITTFPIVAGPPDRDPSP